MEDLFLLIIKESTGTKHNALRQTAQIAYGEFSCSFPFCNMCELRLQLARWKWERKREAESERTNEIIAIF